MSIIKLFSVREKEKEQAGKPDVYQYHTLPQPLRVQIVQICDDVLMHQDRSWEYIHNAVAREKGLFSLSRISSMNSKRACSEYLLNASCLDTLDLIELTFRVIKNNELRLHSTKQSEDAIQELNERFRLHGVGYQFVERQIVRIESQYMHAEAVQPALSLLQEQGFEGPSDEFLKGHEHYRHGRNKEAIAEALKGFESTMKAICIKRGWSLSGTENASQLLKVVFDNNLIPAYLTSHFNSLKSLMEAGLPTVRNKTSGHGQGAIPTDLPDYLASYALHLAASNIVLLVEAHKAMP